MKRIETLTPWDTHSFLQQKKSFLVFKGLILNSTYPQATPQQFLPKALLLP